MARPPWTATTRLVVKLPPSRMTSTSYTMGRAASPGLRKQA